MPFHQVDSIRFLTFEIFKKSSLRHAVFTRQGGQSKGHFRALNLSTTVGDEVEHVRRNERLIFDALGLPIESSFDTALEHGTQAKIADEPNREGSKQAPLGDIILTDKAAVTLFMRYADCLPLLFYDPQKHAIGLAHAGWKGTVLGVAARAVEAMGKQYGSRAADLRVVIGPRICAAHYEVGQDVIAEVEAAFGSEAQGLMTRDNGSTYLDLAAANQHALQQAGVLHVVDSGICTAENTQDWFSHRAENGKTGRFGALMALEPR